MDTFFIDESGNVWHPKGCETIAVAGVLVAGKDVCRVRKHVDQARRRAQQKNSELRYRMPDQRSKRFFFDPERLGPLSVRVWSVCVTIQEMQDFRRNYNPAALYEALLETLIVEVVRALGSGPASIHVDPCSSFVSRAAFVDRVEAKCSGSRVLFSPDSQREKGLQAADMVAGAVRRCFHHPEVNHWRVVEQACGGILYRLDEDEVLRALRKMAKAGAAPVRVFRSGS